MAAVVTNHPCTWFGAWLRALVAECTVHPQAYQIEQHGCRAVIRCAKPARVGLRKLLRDARRDLPQLTVRAFTSHGRSGLLVEVA